MSSVSRRESRVTHASIRRTTSVAVCGSALNPAMLSRGMRRTTVSPLADARKPESPA